MIGLPSLKAILDFYLADYAITKVHARINAIIQRIFTAAEQHWPEAKKQAFQREHIFEVRASCKSESWVGVPERDRYNYYPDWLYPDEYYRSGNPCLHTWDEVSGMSGSHYFLMEIPLFILCICLAGMIGKYSTKVWPRAGGEREQSLMNEAAIPGLDVFVYRLTHLVVLHIGLVLYFSFGIIRFIGRGLDELYLRRTGTHLFEYQTAFDQIGHAIGGYAHEGSFGILAGRWEVYHDFVIYPLIHYSSGWFWADLGFLYAFHIFKTPILEPYEEEPRDDDEYRQLRGKLRILFLLGLLGNLILQLFFLKQQGILYLFYIIGTGYKTKNKFHPDDFWYYTDPAWWDGLEGAEILAYSPW